MRRGFFTVPAIFNWPEMTRIDGDESTALRYRTYNKVWRMLYGRKEEHWPAKMEPFYTELDFVWIEK
jgi:hypothetical protein